MKPFRLASFAIVLLVLAPHTALPQALTSLSSVRVGYNTRKATVRPEGQLKAQIDEIDKQIAEASRLGQTGELRRLYAKGTTLLAGRPWTEELEFSGSLVIRTDRVVVDSTHPYSVRLEQIYRPDIEFDRPLAANVSLRERPAPPGGGNGNGNGTAPSPPAIVKDLGTFDGVSRDLRESPFAFDLDLNGVADGTYLLAIEVRDANEAVGTANLAVAVRKGLDDLTARLENEAKSAPATVRADILYPVDRMRQVNRGRLELRTFDPDKDFAAADALLAAARNGSDPFAGKTGDFKRHYLLESAGEIMPYRLYVPSSYAVGKAMPLILALHGLGGTEDSFFTGYSGVYPKLAEQHGYIIAAPLGYRVDGSYGWGLGDPPADPNLRRVQQRSEEDVMQVLQRVRQQYRIDENRIYLMGHSMGGIGTWKIAPKFPELWAAIAPIAGSGQPATLERIRHIPQIVVHGDADATVNVQGSRTMVAKAKELGIEVKYLEVPGGSHSGVVAPNGEAIFEFFDAHVKKPMPSQP